MPNTEQRVGRGQIQQSLYGRDQFGRKFTDEERRKLLRSGGENILAGNTKQREFLAAAEAEAAAMEDDSYWDDLARHAKGVGETALTIGTSVLADIPAGWAGLMAEPGKRVEAVEGVQEKYTFMPRSEEGMQKLQAVGNAMQKIMEPATRTADAAIEAGMENDVPIPGIAIPLTALTAAAEMVPGRKQAGAAARAGTRINLANKRGNFVQMADEASDGLNLDQLAETAQLADKYDPNVVRAAQAMEAGQELPPANPTLTGARGDFAPPQDQPINIPENEVPFDWSRKHSRERGSVEDTGGGKDVLKTQAARNTVTNRHEMSPEGRLGVEDASDEPMRQTDIVLSSDPMKVRREIRELENKEARPGHYALSGFEVRKLEILKEHLSKIEKPANNSQRVRIKIGGKSKDMPFGDLPKNPMNEKEILFDGAAVDLQPFGDQWYLQSIRSTKRGGGSNAMRQITDAADREGKSIRLFPEPFGDNAMSQADLIKWYEDRGFKQAGDGSMTRTPQYAQKGAGPIGDPKQRGSVQNTGAGQRVLATQAARNVVTNSMNRPEPGRSTIRGAQRKAFPGIYANPREVAQFIEKTKVAPESPWMNRLFGVTREDLARYADRPATAKAQIPNAAANPKGSAAGELIMKPANTRRLINLLDAAQEHAPKLFEGMKGWYEMDPAYHRIRSLVDDDKEAMRLYTQFNHLTGMASPSSDVVTELRRGSAANYLAEQGRFNEFEKYGGIALDQRTGLALPEDLLSFPSHAYHSTAQAPSMRNYLNTGESQMKSPKVPIYIQASEATEIGKQRDVPVGDAHWSRGVGLADTRNMRSRRGQPMMPDKSVTTSELQQLAPWWREEVAKQAGLEAVPAQAVQWGLLSDATGVETVVGAPKLEILSDLIAQTSERMKISPEEARDRVLLGQAQAGYADPKMLALILPPAVVAALTGGEEKKESANALNR